MSKKTELSYLRDILKKYRLSANKTQEELAKSIGITPRFLIAIENNQKYPSLSTLLRFIDVLNIPSNAILHPHLENIDSEDEQLIRILMRLNKRDKEIIRATVQKMLDLEIEDS